MTRRARRGPLRTDTPRQPRTLPAVAPSDRGGPGDEGDASERILAAAEGLYAERGFAISLREITARARVNVAAVNYHYGSKEQLIEILFDRLSCDVNARRLRELDAILEAADHAGRAPDIDDIILAFIRPYLGAVDQGRLLARLILQHRIEPSDLTHQIIRAHFDPMANRFIHALRLAVPGRLPATVAWRYTFMVSTVVLTVADGDQGARLARLSNGGADLRDTDELRAALLAFLRGGLTAPDPIAGGRDLERTRGPSPS